MPWQKQAMKDVASCDKPRGAASNFDPGMSEWGNPTGANTSDHSAEYIGVTERTQGSEPSQYPEEKKKTAIPKVVASEIGTAQTRCDFG